MARRRSDIREIAPRAPLRGLSRPIGAGYMLSAYPYPFGEQPVAWHVFHRRNPNEWYAVGEAKSFDDALDQADRVFGIDLRSIASRDPSRSRTGRRLSERQRAFISRKIPILIDEGYPQRQAVAIAYRMAGVPRREGRRSRRDWSSGRRATLTDTLADRPIAHFESRSDAIRAGKRYERRTRRPWSVC